MCLSLFVLSGYQDSNLGPPAPKAGALTGLRYTPNNHFPFQNSSGYQDSNLGPPAPKAGALTGLRYTPNNHFPFQNSSGYQDSNLGPPAPKAGALTGLRYTPKGFVFASFRNHFRIANAKVLLFYQLRKLSSVFFTTTLMIRHKSSLMHAIHIILYNVLPILSEHLVENVFAIQI